MIQKANVPSHMGHLGSDGPGGRKDNWHLVLTVCQALLSMLYLDFIFHNDL